MDGTNKYSKNPQLKLRRIEMTKLVFDGQDEKSYPGEKPFISINHSFPIIFINIISNLIKVLTLKLEIGTYKTSV